MIILVHKEWAIYESLPILIFRLTARSNNAFKIIIHPKNEKLHTLKFSVTPWSLLIKKNLTDYDYVCVLNYQFLDSLLPSAGK